MFKQAAYCVLLTQVELPPRLIDLVTLYHKYGDTSCGLSELLYVSVIFVTGRLSVIFGSIYLYKIFI